MNGIHTCDFEHPILGRLVGQRRNRNVVQFRSIPYASVPGRFRQAKLIEELSPKQRMCTDYTYVCPQQEQSMDAFGGPIPGEDQRKYDEFSCLNLTITAPAALLEPGCTDSVPVMVYVHGGGFVTAAHYGGPLSVKGSIIVGCDGNHSRVRAALFPDPDVYSTYKLPVRLLSTSPIYPGVLVAKVRSLEPFSSKEEIRPRTRSTGFLSLTARRQAGEAMTPATATS
jgi:hypothetical protein